MIKNFCSLISFLNSICFIFSLSINADFVNSQQVKLTDVQVLTLYKDKYTTGRRSSSVPQLKCEHNYYKCQQYAPSVVQCYNKGHDGVDVQWECKADLDKRVKFGLMKVSCEGYEYPNDPYILAGSCGLVYTLESSINTKNYNEYYHKELYETNKLSNFLTLLIMVVIVLAVYKSCTKNRDTEQLHDFNSPYFNVPTNINEPSPTNGSMFPPPPPPYGFTPTSPHPPGFKPEFTSTEQQTNTQTNSQPTNNNNNVNSNNAQGSSSSWGSFLTGATIGGIGSYLLTRRSNEYSGWTETTRRSESPPPAYDENRTASGFASTSRR